MTQSCRLLAGRLVIATASTRTCTLQHLYYAVLPVLARALYSLLLPAQCLPITFSSCYCNPKALFNTSTSNVLGPLRTKSMHFPSHPSGVSAIHPFPPSPLHFLHLLQHRIQGNAKKSLALTSVLHVKPDAQRQPLS